MLFAIRMVKVRGWNGRYLAIWLSQAAMIGGAGYMEYYVQRHGDQAVFAYSVMSACLVGVVALTILMWILADRAQTLAEKE